MRLISATGAAMLLAGTAHAAPVEPVVTTGAVLSTTVNVTKAPGYPTVEVTINNGTVGASFLQVNLQSPSGHHSIFSQGINLPAYPAPPRVEKIKVAVIPPFTNQAFGVYTEPGTWTVQSIVLGASDGTSIDYGPSQVSALFGNANTFQVVNPASPDITAPTVNNATILTPTVSLSGSSPVAAIRVPAVDIGSGVLTVSIGLSLPGVFNGFYLSTTLPAPASHVNLIAYQALPASTPTGTYTINYVYVCDYANNCNALTTPAEIAAHFSNTTIEVTQ